MPKAIISEDTAVVPGLDGQKMSKSYGNTLPIFGEGKPLRKLINKKVVTDAHHAGGIGYGQFKKDLFEAYWEYFRTAREKRERILAHPEYVDDVLNTGATRAREEAAKVLTRVRQTVGLGWI